MKDISDSFVRDRQHGALTIEYIVVVILLLMLTVGAVDFGIGVRSYNALGHLASEAARYASVRSTESGDAATNDKVKAFVVERADGLVRDRIGVATSWTPSNVRGARVRVDLQYLYEPVTPLLPFVAITLRTGSEMAITE